MFRSLLQARLGLASYEKIEKKAIVFTVRVPVMQSPMTGLQVCFMTSSVYIVPDFVRRHEV